MGTPRKLTPDQLEQIGPLAGQGLGDREIGAIMGVSKTPISFYRKSMGIPCGGKPKKTHPEATRQQVVALHASGVGSKEISKILGVSSPTISRYIRKSGLKAHRYLTDDVIDAAIADFQAGMKIEQICGKHGISEASLERHRESRGLDPRYSHAYRIKLEQQGNKRCHKTGNGCGKILPLSEFRKHTTRGHYLAKCNECMRKIKKAYSDSEHGKSKVRENFFRRKYGISLAEYDALLLSQKGRCQICKRKPKHRLHVDHCHKTDRVRGLLCNGCNTGIGKLRDCPKILRSAIEYLESKLF